MTPIDEPTEEMIRAGQIALADSLGIEVGEGDIRDMYEDMRSAAPPPAGGEDAEIVKIVSEAMRDAWNDICSDTGHHPIDITHRRRKLYFEPEHWARITGEIVASKAAAAIERLSVQQTQGMPRLEWRGEGCFLGSFRIGEIEASFSQPGKWVARWGMGSGARFDTPDLARAAVEAAFRDAIAPKETPTENPPKGFKILSEFPAPPHAGRGSR